MQTLVRPIFESNAPIWIRLLNKKIVILERVRVLCKKSKELKK